MKAISHNGSRSLVHVYLWDDLLLCGKTMLYDRWEIIPEWDVREVTCPKCVKRLPAKEST